MTWGMQPAKVKPQPLTADQSVELPVNSDLLDIRCTVEIGSVAAIQLKLPGRTVKYDATDEKLNEAPLKPINGRISIQMLADRSLTHVVGNDGRVFISQRGPNKVDANKVSIKAMGGSATLVTLEAHQLKSI